MEWLRSAVIDGLQRLLVLRLPNSPAADTVVAVAEVWITAFKHQPVDWQQTLDGSRIAQAFLRATSECEQWPAPKTVLTFMPRRENNLALPATPKKYTMPANIRAEWDRILSEKDAEREAEKQRQREEFEKRRQKAGEMAAQAMNEEMFRSMLQLFLTQPGKDLKSLLKAILTETQLQELNINL